MERICGLPEDVFRVARGGVGLPPLSGGCYIKPLPEQLHEAAARAAAEINPTNAPADSTAYGDTSIAARIASMMALPLRFWSAAPQVLSVAFWEGEGVPPDLQQRIVQHMNEWDCSISFVQSASSASNIRVTLQPEPSGSSSCFAYLGTEALLVPHAQPNMGLTGISPTTPEAELRRIVCHVTGHLLGFHHSALAPGVLQQVDADKAYAWFRQTQGWNPSMVDQQLLQHGASEASASSVMGFWLPAGIMTQRQEVFGAASITAADRVMCQARYPK